MRIAGFFIIILGLALTFFIAFDFFTKEKVVDIGKIEISANKPHHFNWSPWIGVAIIGVGGVVLWKSFKKS